MIISFCIIICDIVIWAPAGGYGKNLRLYGGRRSITGAKAKREVTRCISTYLLCIHIYGIHVHIHLHIYVYIHLHIYIPVHTHTHTRTHMYICMCVCVCKCTYMHACMHACMHTDRHADMQTSRQTDKQTDRHTDRHTYTCTCVFVCVYIHLNAQHPHVHTHTSTIPLHKKSWFYFPWHICTYICVCIHSLELLLMVVMWYALNVGWNLSNKTLVTLLKLYGD
jgi:hypothetical protein